MTNKSTKPLRDTGATAAFDKIFSRAPMESIKDNFDMRVAAVGNTTNYKQLDQEISQKLVILDKLNEAKAKGMPEHMIKEYEAKLGLKVNGGNGHTKEINAERVAMLELASQEEDPDVRAAIMDAAFPEKSDNLSRIERLIRIKSQKKKEPESKNDFLTQFLLEEMKHYREMALTPGQSPIETFKDMVEAMKLLSDAKGGKTDMDLSTPEGLKKLKEFTDSMGWTSSNSDKIEIAKLDIEKRKIDNQLELEKTKMTREFEMQKENMSTAKEAAEILGKTFTKIFEGKAGKEGTSSQRTSSKNVLKMHCTNPGCKYFEGKEQFDIINPEEMKDLEEVNEKGEKIKVKGRIIPCPNDRGGCPNKYILRPGNQVEQMDTNIDFRDQADKKDGGK